MLPDCDESGSEPATTSFSFDWAICVAWLCIWTSSGLVAGQGDEPADGDEADEEDGQGDQDFQEGESATAEGRPSR